MFKQLFLILAESSENYFEMIKIYLSLGTCSVAAKSDWNFLIKFR